MAVYRDGHGGSDWLESLRAILTASFSCGRPWGVELRVLWSGLGVFVLLAFMYTKVLSAIPWWGSLHTLVWSLFMPVAMFVIIYTHEMMHVIAGWRYRLSTSLITLSPLGGLAHFDMRMPNPRVEVVVALAGPAVHLIWLAVLFPAQMWLPSIADTPWLAFSVIVIDFLWVINIALLLFNLLPIFPMDGGRVLRAVLAKFMHPNRATLIACNIGMAGCALLVIYGMTYHPTQLGLTLALAIFILIACLREKQATRYYDSPYDGLQPAWYGNPDAWKRGSARSATDKPGWWARWRQRRQSRAAARAEAQVAQKQQELDQILAKISEVGIANLSKRERAVLLEASRSGRDRS